MNAGYQENKFRVDFTNEFRLKLNGKVLFRWWYFEKCNKDLQFDPTSLFLMK